MVSQTNDSDLQALLERVTNERDNLKELHERTKRDLLNHSLESSLAMKEEIEMLKEETQDREGKIARLDKNSHVEQELEFYQE
jgi:hypothetical protein